MIKPLSNLGEHAGLTPSASPAVPAVLPLVPAMLGRLEAELAMYQRIVIHCPQFGPSLEYGICAVLRDTTSATSRQCGLVQVCAVRLTRCAPSIPHNSSGMQSAWHCNLFEVIVL
jgi:hypothetical protein